MESSKRSCAARKWTTKRKERVQEIQQDKGALQINSGIRGIHTWAMVRHCALLFSLYNIWLASSCSAASELYISLVDANHIEIRTPRNQGVSKETSSPCADRKPVHGGPQPAFRV